MKHSKKQIEAKREELNAKFFHPSPYLEAKWDKRKSEYGLSPEEQDVIARTRELREIRQGYFAQMETLKNQSIANYGSTWDESDYGREYQQLRKLLSAIEIKYKRIYGNNLEKIQSEEKQLEISEWLDEADKGLALRNLEENCKKQYIDDLWQKEDFQKDLKRAQKIYRSRKPSRPDLKQLIDEISQKHELNLGWLLWLTEEIQTGKNDPNNLILYTISSPGEASKFSRLDIYFPLPMELYSEAVHWLRMQELDVFGDYYSQRQAGKAPAGPRDRTIEDYKEIAEKYNKWFQETHLPEKEFCKEFDISRSKLKRARNLGS
jgi:hypothetical protein